MAVCSTDSFDNFTQYKTYQVIDESGSRIKVIDDYGDVRWIEASLFHMR